MTDLTATIAPMRQWLAADGALRRALSAPTTIEAARPYMDAADAARRHYIAAVHATGWSAV